MGDAVGQMLASAVGIAISPLPLIAVVLLLATPRGRADGGAFTAGWVATVALVSTVALLAGSGGGAHQDGHSAAWESWVKLALGVLFLLLAAEEWHGRPGEGREERAPSWMAAVDRFSPARAAGLAVLLAGVNPKNLVLAIGGGLSIAASSADATGKAVAELLLVVIASLCTTVPLAVYLIGGTRSTRTLASWKTWMAAHNAAIVTVVLVVLGAKFIGDAIIALTT